MWSPTEKLGLADNALEVVRAWLSRILRPIDCVEPGLGKLGFDSSEIRNRVGPSLETASLVLRGHLTNIPADILPDVHNANDLYDALLTLIVLPPVDHWAAHFAELEATGRASVIRRKGLALWSPTEKLGLADNALEVVRAWLKYFGRSTASSLASKLGFDSSEIEIALAHLETESQVLRGHLTKIPAEILPDVHNFADDLYDALLTLIVLPPVDHWAAHFAELEATGRASVIRRKGLALWSPTEKLGLADNALEVVRAWLKYFGRSTAPILASKLGFDPSEIEIALAHLEENTEPAFRAPRVSKGSPPPPERVATFKGEAQVLRGQFPNPSPDAEMQWCNRRVLARIHRMTLGRLRREIEPVTAAQFYNFLGRWQHTSLGSQLHGADGLLEIIRQLQGYEIPAAAWETQILPQRIARYEPGLLDELCLSGEVMWARVSPHPALEDGEGRKIRATRVAPISLLLRDDAAWLLSAQDFTLDAGSLSHAALDVLAALERERALFFADLVRASKRLPSETENGLWELVAAGLVTADGFENVRALIDPKRRRGEGKGRVIGHATQPAAGRWFTATILQSNAWKSGLNNFSFVGESCCVTCLPARPVRPLGGICSPSCDGWKRKVKFAVDVSCPVSPASNSRGPKRWT